MALTNAQLAVGMRLSADGSVSDEQGVLLTRYRAVAVGLLGEYADTAPPDVKDQATIPTTR